MGRDQCTASSRLQAINNHLERRNQSPINSDRSGKASLSSSSSPQSQCIDFVRLAGLIPGEGNADGDSLWYVVATAALVAYHQEPVIGELWKYIVTQGGCDEAHLVKTARRIRETCLKASVLVGFPRGINSLLSLQTSIASNSPQIHNILSADKSLRAPLSPEFKFKRGRHFFSQIYASHTDRILQSMDSSSGGDLGYFALASVYGELMGEISILDSMETVMLEFVCCLADDVAPQAKGHFFGCHNLGATGQQVDGAIALVQEIARQLGQAHPGSGKRYEFLNKTSEW